MGVQNHRKIKEVVIKSMGKGINYDLGALVMEFCGLPSFVVTLYK